MNAMSPSDPESNSTFQTLLVDSFVFLSWGIAAVAVIIPLPFTTCWREVEWMFLFVTTFIGTVCELFALFRLFLGDLLSLSLDEQIL